MKKVFKKILSTTVFWNIVSVLLAVVMTSLFLIPSKPSFAYWIGAVTDVAIGSVFALIMCGIIDTVRTGDKVKYNKAFWIVKIIELVSVGMFVIATRTSTFPDLFLFLGLSAVLLVLYAILYVTVYLVSILTPNERQERTHDYNTAQFLKGKITREELLKREYSYRTYATSDGTLKGDLDFNNPIAPRQNADGKDIAVTYDLAKSHNDKEAAELIELALIEEIDATERMLKEKK